MSSSVQNPNEFSVENFVELYHQSSTQQYLSEDDRTAIEQAILQNDLVLLHDIWGLLVAYKIQNQQADKDFVIQKEKILDNYVIEAKSIENRYVNEPRRKMAESAFVTEQNEAEDLLKNL